MEKLSIEEKNGINQKYLHDIFRYDNGKLFWIKKTSKYSNIRIGSRAGTVGHDEYRYLKVNRVQYYEHRLIFIYHYGFIKNIIDHKEGKSNKIENLREATYFENNRNRRMNLDNTSGSKGICFHRRSGQWRAFLCKKIIFSSFNKNETESFIIKERKRLHGEFANNG